jgi:hypothetical protein
MSFGPPGEKKPPGFGPGGFGCFGLLICRARRSTSSRQRPEKEEKVEVEAGARVHVTAELSHL